MERAIAEDFYRPEADAMHALLVKHADLLRGCRSAKTKNCARSRK